MYYLRQCVLLKITSMYHFDAVAQLARIAFPKEYAFCTKAGVLFWDRIRGTELTTDKEWWS